MKNTIFIKLFVPNKSKDTTFNKILQATNFMTIWQKYIFLYLYPFHTKYIRENVANIHDSNVNKIIFIKFLYRGDGQPVWAARYYDSVKQT